MKNDGDWRILEHLCAIEKQKVRSSRSIERNDTDSHGTLDEEHREMGGSDIRDRTFRFACRVVEVAAKLHRSGGVGRLISPQLLHAGTSVGANLEEAYAGQTKPDFIAKTCVSLKEARETKFWLRLIDVRQLLPAEDLKPDIQEIDEIVAILTTILKRARGPRLIAGRVLLSLFFVVHSSLFISQISPATAFIISAVFALPPRSGVRTLPPDTTRSMPVTMRSCRSW
jgi:four helix bundle protein